MERRNFITSIGIGTTVALAGCLGDSETVDDLPTPVLGDESAPAQIEVFEDFACLACRQFNQSAQPQIVSEYIESGDAAILFKDWPIPTDDRWSWVMANAARSVQDREGNDAFLEYKSALYDNQRNISEEILEDEAEVVGVDNPSEVVSDSRNGVYDPVIEADRDEGDDRDVNQTPTVFINGDFIPQPSFSTISSYIENNAL